MIGVRIASVGNHLTTLAIKGNRWWKILQIQILPPKNKTRMHSWEPKFCRKIALYIPNIQIWTKKSHEGLPKTITKCLNTANQGLFWRVKRNSRQWCCPKVSLKSQISKTLKKTSPRTCSSSIQKVQVRSEDWPSKVCSTSLLCSRFHRENCTKQAWSISRELDWITENDAQIDDKSIIGEEEVTLLSNDYYLIFKRLRWCQSRIKIENNPTCTVSRRL